MSAKKPAKVANAEYADPEIDDEGQAEAPAPVEADKEVEVNHEAVEKAKAALIAEEPAPEPTIKASDFRPGEDAPYSVWLDFDSGELSDKPVGRGQCVIHKGEFVHDDVIAQLKSKGA